MSRYSEISLILRLTNLKEPILDSRVYITYYPLGLPLNSAAFPITTYLLYRLLGNAIQQEPDQHISPLIVKITPTEGEKGGEEGEREKEERGEEGGTEGEEREEREKGEEGEKQFELKEGQEEEQALRQEATTIENLLLNKLGEFLNGSPLL